MPRSDPSHGGIPVRFGTVNAGTSPQRHPQRGGAGAHPSGSKPVSSGTPSRDGNAGTGTGAGAVKDAFPGLSRYDPRLLLSHAIRSEGASADIYRGASAMAMAGNGFLGEKLMLLSREEMKHGIILDRLFHRLFPGEGIPDPGSLPLPPIPSIPDIGKKRVIEVIELAMGAELAARDYYISLKDLFGEDPVTSRVLGYLADMELGHYRMLEHEHTSGILGEEFDPVMRDL